METISTTRFGTITIDPLHVVTFPDGLIGFPELTRFVVMGLDRSVARPFDVLQSLDDGSFATPFCDPTIYFPDYLVTVVQDEEFSPDVVFCFVLCTTKLSMNLRAPIIIDCERRTGKQMIADAKYSTRESFEI